MWLSAAHAAAPHRSKPGEDRHHLPIRQEAFSRRQGLSSMASWATGNPPDLRAGHCARRHPRVVHCGPLGIRAGHCRLCAIQAGHCTRRGTRAGHCRLLEAISRVARCLASQVGDPIPMQRHQAGTTRRCRQARPPGPACPCLRAAAHFHHPRPMTSACPQSISAAPLRSALEADQFHRPRHPEAGTMCQPNHPTDHCRGASNLE